MFLFVLVVKKKLSLHVSKKVRYLSRHIKILAKSKTYQVTYRIRKNIFIYQSTAVAGTQAGGDPSPMSLAMPFIDNDLLWCPDNDGNMVDLSACLQDAASVAVGQQNSATNSAATTSNGGGLGELSQSDLSSLVPSLQEEPEQMGDTEDIFKQLSVPFELDNFLDEINNQVKEENNNVPAEQSANNTNLPHKSIKYPIAAANPLLAQKLALPSSGQTSLMSNSTNNGQMTLLTPKIEKVALYSLLGALILDLLLRTFSDGL
ncbi:hypothetical protein QE152_g31063 [Popillia japonica]|uniref:Uncharacterized protein n=1 Tax=Popillia japonica TaxID=7064 RepID=A0AAW1JCS8_POPJA